MRLAKGGMLLVVLASTSANAATFDAVTRGSYSDIGRHFPENLNYIAGNSTSTAELRDFFVFDLSTVNAPIGSATLHLWNPGDPFGYRSEDGSETFLTDAQLNIQTVPLPPSALLLASGLFGLAGSAKRKG